MSSLKTLFLLLFSATLISATGPDYSALKSSVMDGFSSERVKAIGAYYNTNKLAFQKKNTSLFNKATKTIGEIIRLASHKESNFARIEMLMKELFDATRGFDGRLDVLSNLFQPPAAKDEILYHHCERNYRWVPNQKLGEGIGGSVFVACSTRIGGDCNYVAKISPSTLNNVIEVDILKKLDNTDTTPKLREMYDCQKQEPNAKREGQSVIIMDKFDGTLEQFFEKNLQDNVPTSLGSMAEFREKAINEIVSVLPPSTKYTREILQNAPLSTFNLLAFLLVGKVTFKHIRAPKLSADVQDILQKLDVLLDKLSKENVIHRDLKMDNIVYRRDQNGAIELRLIDFGQSLNVDISANQFEVSTYWSANKFVDVIPTFLAENVVGCYDKVTLEMDLLVKYGIEHSFTMTKACRKAVNDDNVSKRFRTLLRLNGYDTLKFETTKQREKRKGIKKTVPLQILGSEYDKIAPIKDADNYYREVPIDSTQYEPEN